MIGAPKKRYVESEGRDENGQPIKFEGEGSADLLGGQGFGLDIDSERRADLAWRLMEQNGRPEWQGDKTKFCEKDALHISISWPGDRILNKSEKIEACRNALKTIGMESAMAVYYDRKDQVHIVASRIHPETGMAYIQSYKSDEKKEYSRKWQKENSEKVLKYKHKWNAANPEKRLETSRRMRAQRRGAHTEAIAQIQLDELLAKQKHKCAELTCRVSIRKRRHLDHVHPLKLGGSHILSNLQYLCPSCNLRKNAKHPIDWANENGRLL